MRQSFNLKLVSLMVLAGMSIFLFAQVSAAAIQLVTNGEDLFPEHTVLASVDVSGQNEAEAIQLITAKTETWKENHPIKIKLDGKTLVLNEKFVQFNVEKTVQEAMDSANSELQVTVEDSYFSELRSQMDEPLAGQFSYDQLAATVMNDAKKLPEESLEYVAYQFVGDQADSLYVPIGKYSLNAPDGVKMERVIKLLNGDRIPHEDMFSFNRLLNEDSVYEEAALNTISSAIYGASLKAGFVIQERHISQRPPSYTEIGVEAKVDLTKGQDLKVFNTFANDYSLQITLEGSEVTAMWVGYPTTSNFHVTIGDTEKITPDTVIQYSAFVNPGSYNVVQEGKDGEVVTVTRTDRSMPEEAEEFISEDYYPPRSRIEEHPSSVGSGGNVPGADDSNEPSDQKSHSNADESGEEADSQDSESHSKTVDSDGSDDKSYPDEKTNEDSIWEHVPGENTK